MENERSLFIKELIEDKIICDLISQIIKINEEDDIEEKKLKDFERKPIMLYINTHGGDVDSGLILSNVIETSKTPVYTIALAKIYSMGLYIYLAGKKKLAYKYSSFLIHEISDRRCGGLITEIEDKVNRGKELQKILNSIIFSKTKITENKLIEIIEQKKDWIFMAEEAKELNIVDKIIGIDNIE